MKIRLNYWQLVLMYLPVIACITLGSFLFSMQPLARVMNFILLPYIGLILSYQTYLGISFNKTQPNQSKLYNINALIPVVFYVTYVFYVIYLSLSGPTLRHSNNGLISQADLNPFATIVTVFIIHSFITFFFINTPYVSRRIRRIADKEEQEILKEEFLMPMKKLLRITFIVIVSCIIVTMAVDIITKGLIPNQD